MHPDDQAFFDEINRKLGEGVTMHYDLNDPTGMAQRYALFFQTLIQNGLDGYEALKLTKTLIEAENRIDRVQIPIHEEGP